MTYRILLTAALIALPGAPALGQANDATATNVVDANVASAGDLATESNVVGPVEAAESTLPGEPQVAAPTPSPPPPPSPAPEPRGFPWGILGLLGLIGLVGSRKAAS